MEKRVLLAVFLSFLVLFVYQSLIVPPAQLPDDETGSTETRSTDLRAPSPIEPQTPIIETPPSTEPPQTTDASGAVGVSAVIADETPRDIVVETEQVIATFSNRGGVLKSWQLKEYSEDSGEPNELVPVLDDQEAPLPFTLEVADEQLNARLREALFRPSAGSLQVGTEPRSLVFEYEDSGGLQIRKEYRFDPQNEPFVVRFSASVRTSRAVSYTHLRAHET